MLRFVASFFSSNTKPINTVVTTLNTLEEISENPQEIVVPVTTTTETEEVNSPLTTAAEYSNDIFDEPISEEAEHPEDISLIQSLRQQQKQELIQKILLRRISHQAIMNYYAQDHLPLSQVQEKLEEDNLPLKVLQEKLKQRDDISIYTATKENINFLLYKSPRRLLTKLRKSKQTPGTNDKTPTKDSRDYDIWDDAMIGRLMNLIDTIGVDLEIGTKTDTIGMETIQEETSEEIARNIILKDLAKEIEKEVMKEVKVAKEKVKVKEEVVKEEEEVVKEEVVVVKEEVVKEEEKELTKEVVEGVVKEDDSDKESYTFSEESAEDDYDQKTIVAESSVVVENNNWEKPEKTKRESVIIAEEIINFGETINVAESLTFTPNKSSVKSTFVNKRSSRTKTDSGYGEDSISSINIKRDGRFHGKRRSILSLRQFPPSSSSTNNNKSIPNRSESLIRNRNNLDRRSSIHSKKSYDKDISRHSSVSSKFSINTTGVITEEPEEEDFDEISFRNKFFTAPKRSSQKSNKSLHFLRNLWKSNHGDGVDENLSSKEIMERYYQQDDGAKSDHDRTNLQQTNETAEEDDQGYSNFYLAMPNGKWMVRTRTGSRKITGTQYVDKEFI